MICNNCKTDKPEDAFYHRTNGKRYSPCIECTKQQRKEHYRKNSDLIQARNYSYKKRNWQKTLERSKCWKRRNRLLIKPQDNAYRLNLKRTALAHYSNGDIKCACCDVRGLVFLTLDHVNGDGAKDRKVMGTAGAGHNFYRWLIKNNFPRQMQVLCWNCNSAKHILGACPHGTLWGVAGI